jgi:hypothetical protein
MKSYKYVIVVGGMTADSAVLPFSCHSERVPQVHTCTPSQDQ